MLNNKLSTTVVLLSLYFCCWSASVDSIFVPFKHTHYHKEILMLRQFNEFKHNLNLALALGDKNKALYLINQQDFSIKHQCLIGDRIIETYLSNNKVSKAKRFVKSFIINTKWPKHVAEMRLFNEKSKEQEGYITLHNFFGSNYFKYYRKGISSEDLFDQLIWIKHINQRDQDFRRLYTLNLNLRNSDCAGNVLHMLDSVNLSSILYQIESFGFPTYHSGASDINVAIFHFNQKKILNFETFNSLNKSIWLSVVMGVTSLEDYCYVVDRYLSTNLKLPELYGLYNSGEFINSESCRNNRKLIGLEYL